MRQLLPQISRRIIRTLLICLAIVPGTGQSLLAQSHCGNGLSTSDPLMRTITPRGETPAKNTGSISYIPLQFHLISCGGSTEMNWYAADTSLVDRAIDTANKQFLPADIQFCKAGPVDHIVNDTFCDIDYYTIFFHYKDLYPDTNVIHVYIPVGFGPSTFVIGYSFATASGSGSLPLGYGMSGPAIAIESTVLPDDPSGKKFVFTHELGHFFGLLHCNNYSFMTGYELADGSNGASTGDFCQDTPAEYGDFFVDSNCVLIPSLLAATDANGDTLRPDPFNIMSDNGWSQKCREYFTTAQINRIKYYRATYLSHLSCNGNPTAVTQPVQRTAVRISPNPASGMQTISIDCAHPGRLQVDLYDMNGRLVRQVAATRTDGGNSILQSDLSALPQGMYYYRVAIGETVQYLRVMKL